MIQGRTKDRPDHREKIQEGNTQRHVKAHVGAWVHGWQGGRWSLGALRSEPGLLRCEQQSDPVSDAVVKGGDREPRLSSDPHT